MVHFVQLLGKVQHLKTITLDCNVAIIKVTCAVEFPENLPFETNTKLFSINLLSFCVLYLQKWNVSQIQCSPCAGPGVDSTVIQPPMDSVQYAIR